MFMLFRRRGNIDISFINGPIAMEVWSHFANMFGIISLPFEDLSRLWMAWYLFLAHIPVNHIRCIIPLVVCVGFFGKEGD